MIDFRPVRDDGYKISYTSPRGEVWGLHSPRTMENRHRRVALADGGFKGARIPRTIVEKETVTQFGARTTGRRVPVASGSLEVIIMSDPQTAGETHRDWELAWSDEELGKITVAGIGGANSYLPVRLSKLSDPARDPFRLHGAIVTVDWDAPSGPWRGAPHVFTGAARVVVGGDVAPSLRLLWDGTATSFTLPSGQTVNLPAVREDGAPSPWMRAINLDRGMQGHVTVAASGATDSATWSRLRGSVYGVTLKPHVPANWVIGKGLTLEVTPRYLSPWR